MTYKLITTKINLYRGDDSPLFGESVTSIELDDEAGGIFFTIKQDPNEFGPGGILRFDFDELPQLIEAIKILEANASRAEQ